MPIHVEERSRAPRGATAPPPRLRAANALLAGALLLPPLLFAGIAAQDRAQTERAANRDLLATLDTLHAHAEKVFQFQGLALGTVAEQLRGLSDERILAEAPLHQARLASLRHHARDQIGLVVVDAAGHPVIEAENAVARRGIDLGDRAYFRHHQRTEGEAPWLADPVVSRADGTPVLLVTQRRNGPDGSFAGLILAGIRIGSLLDTWRQAVPDPDAAVTLFRRDGTILLRSPPPRAGEPSRFAPEGWVLRAVASGEERRIATGPSPLDGSTRRFAWRRIEGFPDLFIAHGVGDRSALAAWRRRLVIHGGFATLASLALGLLALLARRRQIELQALNAGLERRVEARTAEIRASEAQVRLLAREVDHRAKNLLAVVQATLRLTPKADAAAYATAVEGRVAALARVQTLLAGERWDGADLEALLEAELAPFLAPEGQRVVLQGPAVRLPAPLVQPVAMAAHELATNAVKHGGLAEPAGRVRITWEVVGGTLRLRWAERGGPPVAGPPERRGFGSRLLQQVVVGQLGGSLEKRWDAAGLTCAIELPLEPR
jgi:two-component sensor histidine kinase